MATLLGGSKRARFRTWLDVQAGRYDVVVGTRPTVFAPVPRSRPHRREPGVPSGPPGGRAPYYHVRDVALARGASTGATVVLSAMAPSSETAALSLPTVQPTPAKLGAGGDRGARPRGPRPAARARPRRRRAGVRVFAAARVRHRRCLSGLRTAGGLCGVRRRAPFERGPVRCVVCSAPGRCRSCGASDFGLRRGGARARRGVGRPCRAPCPFVASAPTMRRGCRTTARCSWAAPTTCAISARGARPRGDPRRRSRRPPPGLAALERAVTTWTEAIAWARPGGRAIVQSAHPNDPASSRWCWATPPASIVPRASGGCRAGSRWVRPCSGCRQPRARRRAGRARPITLLVSAVQGQTVCLLALDPASVPAFGRAARALAVRDVVTRVEAEPHL